VVAIGLDTVALNSSTHSTLIPVNSPLGTEWRAAVETARAAGELVLRMRPNIRPRTKSDGSPLTDADLASAELIRRRLTDAFPSDRILTEEDDQSGVAESCHRCWIVDPIDGTSAYIKGIDDFDVYLSLIRDGMPVVAVTYQPTKDLTIAAVEGAGVWVATDGQWQVAAAAAPQNPPTLVTRHWLGAPDNLETIVQLAAEVGGQSVRTTSGISSRTLLKPGIDAIIGWSATDRAISAKEWDVAPLDLISRELGGWSSDAYGDSLRFAKPIPNFPRGLVLARTRELGRRIVSALGAIQKQSGR
jgi:myo-inositol-1(or 4)-monophosphatase